MRLSGLVVLISSAAGVCLCDKQSAIVGALLCAGKCNDCTVSLDSAGRPADRPQWGAERHDAAPAKGGLRNRAGLRGDLHMMARRLLAILFALTLFSSSGCCWVRRLLCDDCCSPCDNGAFTYYAGRSCGEQYCGDWVSHPPCDPCDDCGNNVGCCECQRPGRCLLWPIRRLFNFGRCVGQCAMGDGCGVRERR